MSGLAGLLPIIAIAAIFWLLIIRPASRRQKQMAQMQSRVDVGQRIVLTSGIHGTVTELDDATLDVEVAPGVVLTVSRGAIGTVVPAETDDDLDTLDDRYDDRYDDQLEGPAHDADGAADPYGPSDVDEPTDRPAGER